MTKPKRYFCRKEKKRSSKDLLIATGCTVSLDIDGLPKLRKVLRRLRLLEIKGLWRLSSGKKGGHILLHTKRKPKFSEALEIRWMFGDDVGRVIADHRRFQLNLKDMLEVLFYQKNDRKVGRWKKI